MKSKLKSRWDLFSIKVRSKRFLILDFRTGFYNLKKGPYKIFICTRRRHRWRLAEFELLRSPLYDTTLFLSHYNLIHSVSTRKEGILGETQRKKTSYEIGFGRMRTECEWWAIALNYISSQEWPQMIS